MAGWASYFGRYQSPARFPAVEAGMATSPKSVRYYVQVAILRLDNAIVMTQAMTAMQSKKRLNRRGCCPAPNGNCSPSIMPLTSLTWRLSLPKTS